ncbi:MAG: acyl-CoA/acyl-ACP dehydrogenase [Anaerolineae bacterium]|nr:acyl-CoA/acyl-ACP dehydrogenase [Anaerolineae bacterium]
MTVNFLELARELADDFATRAQDADRAGKLPAEDVKALRASGYFQMVIPREYGGMALPMRDCLEANVELARGSASTAMVAGMTLHTFGHAREVRTWEESYMERFCRAVIEQGALFNVCASEPAMGSPSRGQAFATTAARHPSGGWRLNGHKTWITGGRHLTHMLTRLVLKETDSVGLMLVTQDTPGLRWEETWCDSLSLRASDSHDMILEDACVPDEFLVRQTSDDESHPSGWFPMTMASVYLGAALAARDAVIRYALDRVPTALGKPIATLPKIQREIGLMDMHLQAAQALFYEVAEVWDHQPENRPQLMGRIAAAKQFVVETALLVTEKALQTAGGKALTRELPLERHFRDVQAGTMQPPSGDTALEIIGRGVIGEM